MAYPSVNFRPTVPFMGQQPISAAESAQKHFLGTIVRAADVTYGEGEFIYLAGVASTAAGDLVCFDAKAGTTVRAVAAGATSVGPAAIAMAATGAGQYGWYQLSGSGPINAATVVANTQPFLTSTAGQVDDAGIYAVAGALFKAATSGGFATVQLDRPSINLADDGTFPSGIVSDTVASRSNADPGLSFSTSLTGTATGFLFTASGSPSVLFNFKEGTTSYMSMNGSAELTTAAGRFKSNTADGASAVGHYVDTVNGFSTTGAKLFQMKNGGTEKAFVDKDGNFETPVVGSGFILKSPNGTRYLIKVANDGTLSASAA